MACDLPDTGTRSNMAIWTWAGVITLFAERGVASLTEKGG